MRVPDPARAFDEAGLSGDVHVVNIKPALTSLYESEGSEHPERQASQVITTYSNTATSLELARTCY